MKFHPGRDTEYQLEKLLNSGLDFIDNIKGGFIELTTTGGTETIQHNLGYVPMGWLVIWKDGAVDLYAENTASWDRQTMYLRSSVTSVTVRLFVM